MTLNLSIVGKKEVYYGDDEKTIHKKHSEESTYTIKSSITSYLGYEIDNINKMSKKTQNKNLDTM